MNTAASHSPALTHSRAVAQHRRRELETVAAGLAPALLDLTDAGYTIADTADIIGAPRAALARVLAAYADQPHTSLDRAGLDQLIACPHAYTYLDSCPGCDADE